MKICLAVDMERKGCRANGPLVLKVGDGRRRLQIAKILNLQSSTNFAGSTVLPDPAGVSYFLITSDNVRKKTPFPSALSRPGGPALVAG